MAEALKVQVRETRGKRNARRLRKAGFVPAILYGHGQTPVGLSVAADDIAAAVRHGIRLVDLQGAVQEKAFLRELQWDPFGTHVVHIDFTRVAEGEKVQVHVAIELRGQAPGVKDGGVVEHQLHEIEIECLATAIPEKLQVNINHLNLNDVLTVAKLDVPAGVTLLAEPETIVVQCVLPAVEEELVSAEAGAGEPEVIGRKAEEEEEED
ncbi:MAG: 50S ribosomal protein L25 [Pirellulales bacterium]